VRTRWNSHFEVFVTCWQDLPIVLRGADAAEQQLRDQDSRDAAVTLRACLLNPFFFIGLLIAKIMLKPLQCLIKNMQSSKSYQHPLAQQIESARSLQI
jgi:hypothetical protein